MRKKESIPKHHREYKESKTKEWDLKGLCNLTKYILNADDIDLFHKKYFIDKVIWKITELDDKYNLRYRTVKSLSVDKGVQHEHVVTKKYLIDKLLKFPELYEEILSMSIACVVTKSEHEELSKIKYLEGWARYDFIGIEVKDMLTNQIVDLKQLILEQQLMFDKIK